MTEEQIKKETKRIIEILKSHDIIISLWGCGGLDCLGARIEFSYKGEKILDKEFVDINMHYE